jgi:hypothetical protein
MYEASELLINYYTLTKFKTSFTKLIAPNTRYLTSTIKLNGSNIYFNTPIEFNFSSCRSNFPEFFSNYTKPSVFFNYNLFMISILEWDRKFNNLKGDARNKDSTLTLTGSTLFNFSKFFYSLNSIKSQYPTFLPIQSHLSTLEFRYNIAKKLIRKKKETLFFANFFNQFFQNFFESFFFQNFLLRIYSNVILQPSLNRFIIFLTKRYFSFQTFVGKGFFLDEMFYIILYMFNYKDVIIFKN